MNKTMILFLAAAAAFSGCVQDIDTVEKGERGAPRKVLVASVKSDFKQQVLDKTVEALGTKDYYFKFIGPDQLAQEDAAPYGAIVLVGTFMAARLDARVMACAGKHSTDPKLIIFYTQGAEGPPSSGVRSAFQGDVVTSASSADRVGPKAEELAALIRKRFP